MIIEVETASLNRDKSISFQIHNSWSSCHVATVQSMRLIAYR